MSSAKAAATAKEEVRHLLEHLPEDASFEEIQYHIYVRGKVAAGLVQASAGNVIGQEDLEKRLARWLEL